MPSTNSLVQKIHKYNFMIVSVIIIAKFVSQPNLTKINGKKQLENTATALLYSIETQIHKHIFAPMQYVVQNGWKDM